MPTLSDPSVSNASIKDRVMGCWLGKAVGGTLGMPFEGDDGPLDLTFYDPIPTEMLPNDDLDLQVLWACVLDKMDPPRVDRRVLGKAFLEHVEFPWDEYGVAIRNLRDGLEPPVTGSYDNWFTQGMGGAIRSELWACLAPGDPALAGAYARQDACLDHDGEGIWAEVFLAALEAAAFVESDRDRLLDLASIELPVTSLVRQAIHDTRVWWERDHDWRLVRQRILEHYGHENFTDVVMNLAFTVLGWLAGEGDFSRSICIAVNCGKDTDCTGATLGALLGILDPTCIDERWLKPIGRSLVINDAITGIEPPNTLDGFTDLVLSLRERLQDQPAPQAWTDPAAPKHLGIPAQIAFTPGRIMTGASPTAPELPANARSVRLPGTVASWPVGGFEDEVMLLRFRFTLSGEQTVRVMFNTHEDCRVWMDGQYAFGRESGRLCPSLHRVPLNQFADRTLTKGEHELIAAVRRPQSPQASEATWIVGVGDAKSKQWLTGVFGETKLFSV